VSGPALLQLSRVVIDLVHRVARLPALGEDVEATDVIVTAGGGFNAMVAARRFGIDVAYGGPIGTGAFADLALALLAEAGLPVLATRRPEPHPSLSRGQAFLWPAQG
jgi:sugar/nucleoside kinase (ribokinase family)